MTIFAVAMALQRNPLVVEAIKQNHYDVVSHGLRWIHYQNVDIETEKAHMAEAMQILKDLFGNIQQVGIQGVIVPIPVNSWLIMIRFNMTVIIMEMIYLFGQHYRKRMVKLVHISLFHIRLIRMI
jgi:hypothetical protein